MCHVKVGLSILICISIRYVIAGIKYEIAGGRVKSEITDLMKGEAVKNPKERLEELGSLPAMKSGKVEAGNVQDFPILTRLPRSITGKPRILNSGH